VEVFCQECTVYYCNGCYSRIHSRDNAMQFHTSILLGVVDGGSATRNSALAVAVSSRSIIQCRGAVPASTAGGRYGGGGPPLWGGGFGGTGDGQNLAAAADVLTDTLDDVDMMARSPNHGGVAGAIGALVHLGHGRSTALNLNGWGGVGDSGGSGHGQGRGGDYDDGDSAAGHVADWLITKAEASEHATQAELDYLTAALDRRVRGAQLTDVANILTKFRRTLLRLGRAVVPAKELKAVFQDRIWWMTFNRVLKQTQAAVGSRYGGSRLKIEPL
jgi:hypothetical protein